MTRVATDRSLGWAGCHTCNASCHASVVWRCHSSGPCSHNTRITVLGYFCLGCDSLVSRVVMSHDVTSCHVSTCANKHPFSVSLAHHLMMGIAEQRAYSAVIWFERVPRYCQGVRTLSLQTPSLKTWFRLMSLIYNIYSIYCAARASLYLGRNLSPELHIFIMRITRSNEMSSKNIWER